MKQKNVWDNIAEKWLHWRTTPFKFVLEFAEKYDGKRILDIGCGNCRQLIPFKDRELYGLDFSSGMINKAEWFCEDNKMDVTLTKGKATDLPYKDKYFDVALMIAVLHHVKNPKKALKEMFKVLKRKGVALISVWYKPGKAGKEEYKYFDKKNKEKTKRYYYFFEKEELRELIQSVGFAILDEKVTGGRHKNLVFEIQKA